MSKYPFLSPEWITAAKAIRDDLQHRDELKAVAARGQSVRMNLIINEVPFGTGSVNAHIDSSTDLTIEEGHLDHPDVTLTVDHDTARTLFVEQNTQLAMQSFLAGKLKVHGDMSKLLALGSLAAGEGAGPGAAIAQEIAQRVKDITTD